MSNLSLATSNALDIQPVTGRIGAEIRGVRLSGQLEPATVEAIRAALLRHKVIFFRGQAHLQDSDQEAFARLLGEPVSHPTVPVVEGTDHLLELDSHRGGRANSWHTDVTFVDAYPQASILRGVTIPEVGGDTVWANTATAYDDLPPPLKALAEQLWAVHSNEYDYASYGNVGERGRDAEALKRYREVFVSTRYETEHPVVRVHPETGEKTLILGHFVKNFVGLTPSASAHVLELLQAYVTRLENIVRWRWQAGDVAIWDNRATQHYAVNDYGDAHRVVRRVTLKGDVPVSVDGRRSFTRSVEPNPAAKAA
ncbi:TauD/TfdA family dioxygenase [Paraburkholderia fungorum]|jgi:taurine dioxygenase|uniref:TauD/TfdA family dioxygenase n=1 Tax=Paraburkholderia fungorum TaxID=134537 RepID=A0AAP1KV29_9BURK|nr:TauD/TfdA family dioxygenase [Paraburkholderia fungorum]KFX62075.1 taurine dioxygenase [Burkholderia sp. K24]MBB4514081.1 taurine dioxygenase [Paraburkholderia fungorum]MBB6202377.1 taurine dioxygenase [Paraburkholderia fungorum]MDT8842974.1 TauD/TfdA family dioxygenase [Paraburkholderia fungorum]PZR39771.1 MAG: TauD/TfdA family dioxygenase [Paraburkholderia fungorum]